MKKILERIYAASPAALQTLALNAYGWKIRHERFNDEYRRWQRVFAENERRPPPHIARMQDTAVRDLIAPLEGSPPGRGCARLSPAASALAVSQTPIL
jgi:hypothetical protein